MNKPSNQRKFDLESIICVESINDNQAEILTAGGLASAVFAFSVETRDGSFDEFVFGEPGSTNISIPIDSSSRSLEIGQLDGTEFVRATFIDGDTGATISERNISRNGGRVRRRQIREAVSEGADTLFLELDD